jgi:transcriptional regulator with XRE-family HTH domain
MPSHPQLVLLGRNIRRLREKRGISQESFALEADLARSYFSGIERGRRNLAALNLIKVADTLGCEVGELFPPMKELVSRRSVAQLSGRRK